MAMIATPEHWLDSALTLLADSTRLSQFLVLYQLVFLLVVLACLGAQLLLTACCNVWRREDGLGGAMCLQRHRLPSLAKQR